MKLVRLIAILIFILLTLPAVSAGKGDLRISAGVKPKETTVGSSMEYRVSIAGDDLSKVEILLPEKREFFPPEKKEEKKKGKKKDAGEQDSDEENPSSFVPLYVIHSARKEDSSEKDLSYVTVIMRLSYFRPGTYQLPLIEIKGADKISVAYKIPTVTVKPLNKEGQLSEIEPPLDLGGNYTRLILIIAATVLLTLLGVFVYRYVKRRREEAAAVEVVIPPIEIFRSELKKLKGEKLIAADRVEEYIVGISTIFRRYLSGVLDFDAMEMTTDEVNRTLKKLKRRHNLDPYHDVIMSAFNLWDLSKFAEFTPSKEILSENLKTTSSLAENLNRETGHDTV